MNNESSYIDSEQLETVRGVNAIDESEDKEQVRYEPPLSSPLFSPEQSVEIDQGNSSTHSVTTNNNIKSPSTPSSSSSITAISPVNVTGSTSIDTSATTMICEANGLIKGQYGVNIKGGIIPDLGGLNEVKEEREEGEEMNEWDRLSNESEVVVTSGTASPARSELSTRMWTVNEIILMETLERYNYYMSMIIEWGILGFSMGIFVIVYCILFMIFIVVDVAGKCGNPFREPGRRVGGLG